MIKGRYFSVAAGRVRALVGIEHLSEISCPFSAMLFRSRVAARRHIPSHQHFAVIAGEGHLFGLGGFPIGAPRLAQIVEDDVDGVDGNASLGLTFPMLLTNRG